MYENQFDMHLGQSGRQHISITSIARRASDERPSFQIAHQLLDQIRRRKGKTILF
jgi:hypothetical protein